MDTKRRNGRRPPRPLYVKEWRNFMGVKALPMADALGIARESYYRLERQPYKLNGEEMLKIADVLGVNPHQLWFHPPIKGRTEGIDLNALIEDLPAERREMVVAAFRGMIGK